MVLAALLVSALSAAPQMIEDDFQGALAKATAEKKLLFVDAWAPWCHSCLYLREHVLTRPAFGAFEKDLVFAAIDTEKAGAAAFLEKYPVNAWPTLYFIDPSNGNVVLKWLGTLDEKQMAALLTTAQKTAASGKSFVPGVYPGAGSEAAAVIGALSAMYDAQDFASCTRTAVDKLDAFARMQDRAGVVTSGIGCLEELPPSAASHAMAAKLWAEANSLVKEPQRSQILVDDVSGIYGMLVEKAERSKDSVRTKKIGQDWFAFLNAAAAAAKTPAERAVYDPHRVLAAIAAGKPGAMLKPLQQSERDFPEDYNPPARLALVHREMKNYPEALKDSDRALSKCTGPRKISLFQTKAGILEQSGDLKGQRQALAEAISYAKSLPIAQVGAKRIATLEAKYQALPAPAATAPTQ